MKSVVLFSFEMLKPVLAMKDLPLVLIESQHLVERTKTCLPRKIYILVYNDGKFIN